MKIRSVPRWHRQTRIGSGHCTSGFETLFSRRQSIVPGHKCRFKIGFCRSTPRRSICVPRCSTGAKFRTTEGAVKLHLLLDHDGHLPRYAVITQGKKTDIDVARRPAAWIDRGLRSRLQRLPLVHRAHVGDMGFVTRMRDTARYEVSRRAVPEEPTFAATRSSWSGPGMTTSTLQPVRLRRIEFVDHLGKEYVFFTNRLDLAARTIAAIYDRQSWQIELFFRAIKQSADQELRQYFGERASHPDLDCVDRFHPDVSLPPASRQVSLVSLEPHPHDPARPVQVCDLWTWLNDPFTPPDLPDGTQLSPSDSSRGGVSLSPYGHALLPHLRRCHSTPAAILDSSELDT